MTWLLVLVAWTVCAAAGAPVVGRVLGHGGARVPLPRRPVQRRTLPSPREPLVLR